LHNPGHVRSGRDVNLVLATGVPPGKTENPGAGKHRGRFAFAAQIAGFLKELPGGRLERDPDTLAFAVHVEQVFDFRPTFARLSVADAH